jgi:hypothetical protein
MRKHETKKLRGVELYVAVRQAILDEEKARAAA